MVRVKWDVLFGDLGTSGRADVSDANAEPDWCNTSTRCRISYGQACSEWNQTGKHVTNPINQEKQTGENVKKTRTKPKTKQLNLNRRDVMYCRGIEVSSITLVDLFLGSVIQADQILKPLVACSSYVQSLMLFMLTF